VLRFRNKYKVHADTFTVGIKSKYCFHCSGYNANLYKIHLCM